MDEDKKTLKLLDLVDIKFLQNFQDAFAKTANLASIMVDDQGPITNPVTLQIFVLNIPDVPL